MRDGRGKNGKANIRGALGGMLWDEVLGFSGDTMGGGSEVGHRSKGTKDDIESITNGVVEAGFAVAAAKEVVTIGVKGLVAVVAGRGRKSRR